MRKLLGILLIICSVGSYAQNTGGVFLSSKQQTFNVMAAATGRKVLDGKSQYLDTINFKIRAFTSVAEANSYLPSLQRSVGQMMLVNTGGSLSAGVITGGVNDYYFYKNGIADGDLVALFSIPTLQQVLAAGNQITAGTQLIKGTGTTVLQWDSLTNINWRHKGFFRVQADGGQMSLVLQQTSMTLTAADGVTISTPSAGFFVLPPAAFSKPVTIGDTLKYTAAILKPLDTTAYKIGVIDASGNMFKMNWQVPGAGSGGSPGGSDKDVQVNNTSAFGAVPGFTANSSTHTVSADSFKTKNFQIGTIAKHADSSVYFGTSITEGNAGVVPQSNRYSTVTANSFNTLEANHGQSGASLQVDMLAKIGSIAPYNYAFHRFIAMEWLANDIINIGNDATWDTAHAGPIYRKIIDTCLARGWPANKIVLLSPGMISPTLWTNATLVRQAQYFSMAQSVATTRGVIFVDLYHSQEARGGTTVLTVDGIHPTNGGAALYAQLIRQSLTDTVNIQSQSVGVTGLSEFNKMKLRIVDTATSTTIPVGIDSIGNLKRYWRDDIIANYTRLPQKQSASIGIYGNVTAGGFGNFGGDVTAGLSGKLGANVTQLDAVFTAGLISGSFPGFSLKGAGYSANQKMYDRYIDDGHLYERLISDDVSMGTTWLQVNRTGTTVNNVAFEHGNTLIGTTTDNTSGAKLQVAGNATMGSENTGELTLVINTASDDHVEFLNYLGENFITGLNTARTAGKPLAFAGSYTAFGCFGGSNTYNEAFRVSSTGNIGVGITTPAASSLLDITSTTKGFLLPRMTTSQRNAISSPATSLLIYNTTVDSFQYYASGVWQNLGAGGSNATWGSITGTLSSQSDLNTALGLKADLASPSLIGTPTAPTATGGTNTTQVATTAFVTSAVSALPTLAANSFTSTLSNTTNLTGAAFTQATYMRVGNIVSVTISGSFTPTLTATATVMTFTLPITTSITSQSGIGHGTVAYNAGSLGYFGAIADVVSGTTGTLTFYPTVTAGTTAGFSFSIQYKL